VEVIFLDGDDMFESIKKALGNPRLLGMAPKFVNDRVFEFWYDDTGDQYEDDNQNRAMENLLGGGFYGPGIVLERKEENDKMKAEDYADILASWDETINLYEYLSQKM
jgi:hypothetical protein